VEEHPAEQIASVIMPGEQWGHAQRRSFCLVVRHVEHPLVRHGVVVEVKHLLAGWATAAHAIVGAVLLAVVTGDMQSIRASGTPHAP